MPSSKPKPPTGLADFVARACSSDGIGDKEFLECFRKGWREAFRANDPTLAPSIRSVARDMGLGRDAVSARVSRLLAAGKLLEHGANSARRFTPNEKEFTGRK